MKSFIILCGGKSRRMGQDKGSMELYGKPMVVHVIETIATFADEIVLVLRDEDQVNDYKKVLKELKSSEKTNIKVCTDVLNDQGPLAGILTGFQGVTSNKALVIPCDSPYVSEFFVDKIFEISKDSDFDAYVPKWSDGRLEPLHSIYKKESYSLILKLLLEDIRDVKTFISRLNVKFIDAESLDSTGRSFVNINQMKDISKFDKKS